MSHYDNIRKAFDIFDKYEHSGETSAEHDEFFAGPSPEVVSEEDTQALKELGWYPSEYSCFYMFP